jgi:hypothetical protein
VAKAAGSGQEAQSSAQLPDRVGRRAVGVHQRAQLGIRITKSVLIGDHNIFERARLLTNSGCQIGWGRWLSGERRKKISAEYVEYLSRINGSYDRVAPPWEGVIHARCSI